ncbi:hypothetical protein LSH36_201g05073 [Paralvinella palmiformis]|uniref:Brain protein I3 n=1 Tax=Paralvinella palmiformis TaxID=53620 RepID=A0AAD9JQB8_9ANNE|nr:hypothetical protein LSH36_201g05073 [Paralvinella palmiformis]
MDPESAGNDNDPETRGLDNDPEPANEETDPESAGVENDPKSPKHEPETKNRDVNESSANQGSSDDELTRNHEDETTTKTPPGEDDPLLNITERNNSAEWTAAGTGASQAETEEHDITILVGAEGTVDTRNDSSDDEAPPLPQKRPLSSITDEMPGSTDHDQHGGDSDSSRDDNASRTSSVSGRPTTVSTVQSSVTVPVTIEVNSAGATPAPNEPPPPYPGAPRPVPGRDPYDGSPGDDRIVSVQRTGNCPKCQVGNIMKNFSFCGICLAIWLFPCGLICLFCMRQKKCSHCGAKF